LPPELRGVARLIDAGELERAREQLDQNSDHPADLLQLIHLKLRVALHELTPSNALESVLEFLVAEPNHPAALELYRELSMLQYASGNSCLSHSHPPPAPPRSR
jgi:hypothetical protein